MIWTVFQINLRRLLHSRVELLLTFVVPIAFFSVFALIFGNGIGSSTTSKIKVVAVDQVGNQASKDILAELSESAGLRFMRDPLSVESTEQIDAAEAEKLVRQGTLTMAIVLKPQSGIKRRSVESADPIKAESIQAELLSDASDQVASQVVTALVGRSIMLAQAAEQEREFSVFGPSDEIETDSDPAIASQSSPAPNAQFASSKTASSSKVAADQLSPIIDLTTLPSESEVSEGSDGYSSSSVLPDSGSTDSSTTSFGTPVQVIDVIGEGKSNPVVSMYAAGIAVMFLLFGATGGGGTFLEERENQTLDRLLSTQLSMDQLILGKWFYMTCLGILQVGVMFLWAQGVFGVDLIGHFDGFLMMTIVTAAAASAFGLFLATLCKSRGELNGLSVILILTMSALGGSMVPRYIMSERLQQFGLWTFNAWALDGYNKVFWRELPASELAPQLLVLMISGMAFLVAARFLAYRWETD